jgi:hypothetical protein
MLMSRWSGHQLFNQSQWTRSAQYISAADRGDIRRTDLAAAKLQVEPAQGHISEAPEELAE